MDLRLICITTLCIIDGWFYMVIEERFDLLEEILGEWKEIVGGTLKAIKIMSIE